MKRIVTGALALALLLAGCGGGEGKTADPQTVVDTYLESQAYSDQLEALDPEVAVTLHGLAAEDVSDIRSYCSTGATAEELTVVTAADEAAAGRVQEALQTYVDDLKVTLADYQPAEVDKLEHAVLRTAGTVVILMVASDGEYAAGVDGLIS